MTTFTTARALRTGLRLTLVAFVAGLLISATAGMASAAPGNLSICPVGEDCDPPVTPDPDLPGADDLTTCPEFETCGPPEPTPPDDFKACLEADDCPPEPEGPEGPDDIVTCTQDCGPTEEPTEEPTDEPTDPGTTDGGEPGGTVDGVPVPTRIDTGMGGTASTALPPLLLAGVPLLVLAGVLVGLVARGAAAHAGARR